MDLRCTAPWGRLFDIEDPTEFRREYRARLHRRSNVILRDLEHLRACYPGVTLVLMCFEYRPEDCHRSVLAQWLEQRLGVVVPEIG